MLCIDFLVKERKEGRDRERESKGKRNKREEKTVFKSFTWKSFLYEKNILKSFKLKINKK